MNIPTQPSSVGIDATTPLVALVAKVVTAIVHADKNNNGKIDANERTALLAFLSLELYLAIGGLSVKQVGEEIKDLQVAEIAQLVNVFSMNHQLNDTQLEALIEDTLKWLVDGVSLVTGFRLWRESKQANGTTLPSLQRISALNQLSAAYATM